MTSHNIRILKLFSISLLCLAFASRLAAQAAPETTAQKLEEAVKKVTEAATDAKGAAVDAKSAATDAKAAAKETKDLADKIKEAQENGIAELIKNFGVGVGIALDSGSRTRVDDAAIDANNIVRVNKKSNNQARFFLEAHALGVWQKDSKGGKFTKDNTDTSVAKNPKSGMGPFVAMQLGGDRNQVIQSLGGGWMFGFRGSNPDKKGSFNVGIGAILDPSTKVMGDEFTENQPAPKDPTGKPIPIRFVTKDKGAILFLVSFGL